MDGFGLGWYIECSMLGCFYEVLLVWGDENLCLLVYYICLYCFMVYVCLLMGM